jgi:hypothetical protein
MRVADPSEAMPHVAFGAPDDVNHIQLERVFRVRCRELWVDVDVWISDRFPVTCVGDFGLRKPKDVLAVGDSNNGLVESANQHQVGRRDRPNGVNEFLAIRRDVKIEVNPDADFSDQFRLTREIPGAKQLGPALAHRNSVINPFLSDSERRE